MNPLARIAKLSAAFLGNWAAREPRSVLPPAERHLVAAA